MVCYGGGNTANLIGSWLWGGSSAKKKSASRPPSRRPSAVKAGISDAQRLLAMPPTALPGAPAPAPAPSAAAGVNMQALEATKAEAAKKLEAAKAAAANFGAAIAGVEAQVSQFTATTKQALDGYNQAQAAGAPPPVRDQWTKYWTDENAKLQAATAALAQVKQQQTDATNQIGAAQSEWQRASDAVVQGQATIAQANAASAQAALHQATVFSGPGGAAFGLPPGAAPAPTPAPYLAPPGMAAPSPYGLPPTAAPAPYAAPPHAATIYNLPPTAAAAFAAPPHQATVVSASL